MNIRETIESLFGSKTSIISSHIVNGGDINETVLIELSGGEKVFLKTNRDKDIPFFKAEADGLKAIEDTRSIRVPKVIAIGKDENKGAFLIMEYIEETPRVSDYWERFANDLAKMHGADTLTYVNGGKYGFVKDNYIGSREQKNIPSNSFIDFFRDQRLLPRFNEAMPYFDNDMRRRIDKLLEHLERYLVEPKRASLLHGDLWGGNFITGSDGCAWLIDPAVYVGCAEADIAMTELFGGFSEAFYKEYGRVGLLMDGYEDRRDIYNLYHLLNHLISFGRSYYGSVVRIVEYYEG